MSNQQRVKTTRMFPLFSALLILLTWTPAYSSPGRPAVHIDRAIAVVNQSTVVTKSDLRLHEALAELDPSFVPILHYRPDRIQQDVIDVAVLRSIARRVPVYQPKPHQVRARVSRFRTLWRNNRELTDFLSTYGLEGERLPAALRRRMVVERVVHRNFGPPGEDIDAWTKQFDAWLEKERSTTRVRLIPAQEAQ